MTNEFRLGYGTGAVACFREFITVTNARRSSVMLNLVDAAYAYEDPDRWHLPPDSKIHYRWKELPRDFEQPIVVLRERWPNPTLVDPSGVRQAAPGF